MSFSKNLALLETLLKTLTSLYRLSVIPAKAGIQGVVTYVCVVQVVFISRQ